MMNIEEFEAKHPDFAGLADDFSDPPPSHTTDEALARSVRRGWDDWERIRAIGCLLREAHSIRANLDEEWVAMGEFLSRPFSRREDAVRWLDRVVPVWEEELARLERGYPGAP